MKVIGAGAAKNIAITVVGWLLVLVGLAALVLPGPGLLALFAGMAILATRYEWAEKRVRPIEAAAMRTAQQSVANWYNIVLSALGASCLIAFGVFWGVHPAMPSWWPLSESLWIPGGWGTGGTLIGSGIIAFGLIIFSYIKFRPAQH